MSKNMLQLVKETLREDDRLSSGGRLLKNKIMELTLKQDKKLIELLLSNDRIKEHFFTEVNGTLVFDKDTFIDFVNNKQFLPDSYTTFKNKIGLTEDGEYLDKKKEVTLAWPYKDCVLEGDQADPDEDRDEIFWNETLAPDEVDRLLDPQVLTNFKRIDSEGKHPNPELDSDENFVVKGNNLLTLHSLKEKYRGKIKLIYIDPPYNTGDDDFGYNDKFNHSTWLTFMKNRLQVAKELLRKDGVIFISIDHNELATLKLLCDEIFGEESFEAIFNVKVRHEERILRRDSRYQRVIEYLICYSKEEYNPAQIKEPKSESPYKYIVETTGEPEKTKNIGEYNVEIYNPKNYEIRKLSPGEGDLRRYTIRGSLITQSGSASEFYEKHLRERRNTDGLGALYKVIGMGVKGDGLGYRYIMQPESKERKNGIYFQGRPINKKRNTGRPYPNFFDFVQEFNKVGKEGDVTFRRGKKPIAFLQKLFEIADLKGGDIVLDFFAGSGSTAHAVIDWNSKNNDNLRFILCEQMEYINSISVPRLVKALEGSEEDFLYFELMKWNQKYIDEIEKAESRAEILEIWDRMKEKAFLSYKVSPKKFDENVNKFKDLSLENQKKFLMECLDKNHLYVNLSEIDDEEYDTSEEDKKMNKQFYGGL